MENKEGDDSHDKSTVDINDKTEIESLHKEWKQFSREQIIDAVKKYGPNKKDIEAYLIKNASAE